MPVRAMLLRLVLVAANGALGAAGFGIAGTGHAVHAVVGFLFVGLAVIVIGLQGWDGVRMLRDRASSLCDRTTPDSGDPGATA
jgi:hypothetical protein